MYRFDEECSQYELGAFAESAEEIDEALYDEDGNELEESVEALNAYNYCLAEDYALAFEKEDFEAIGIVYGNLIQDIVYWLNYDGEIGQNDVKRIQGISNGTLITNMNRSIIDAIYDCHNACLADAYIGLGIYHPKLLLTSILCESSFLNKFYIFDAVFFAIDGNCEKFINILKELFSEIDIQLEKIDDVQMKKVFLMDVRDAINSSSALKKCSNFDIYAQDYESVKQMIRIKEETAK